MNAYRFNNLPGRIVVILAATFTTLLLFSIATAEQKDPTSGDDFLVVDCLLPGKVRKLGGLMTYQTPRRPARLPTTVCEIRGGEYVAYDRANYKTALDFWLGPAWEGDSDAQAYVGEIYEKGLGTTPNYEIAAEWYQEAANQGHERAKLRLGYLYEQGLGVEKDPLKAVNLYREATGITDDELTYVSEVTAVRAESQRVIDALTTQLESQTEELQEAQARLSFSASKLGKRRAELREAQSEIARLEEALLVAQRSGASPENQAELERVQDELSRQQRLMAGRISQVAELERESGELRAALADRSRDVAQRDALLQARLSGGNSETQEVRQALAEKEEALYNSEKRIAALIGDLAAARAEIARNRLEMSQQGMALSEQERELVQEREQKLAEQENLIVTLQQEQDQLLAQLSELRKKEREHTATQAAQAQELESVRAQLASAQKRLLESEQQVAELSSQLAEGRERLAFEREQLARRKVGMDEGQRQEIERLTAQLLRQESRVAQQEALLKTFEEDAEYYQEEIARLRSQEVPQVAMRSIGPRPPQAAVAPSRKLNRSLKLGTHHALIIGNNRYENLPPLETAINDANAVAEVLQTRYGFSTRVLTNATRNEILSTLNEYRETLKNDESLMIYYAGHGEIDERNLRGYWLPVNADQADTTEWVSDQMITDQISLMEARHVLVVADSCYSGVMTRNSGIRLVAKGGSDAQLKRLLAAASLPSRTVLTSGGVQPVMDGGGGRNSIFAKHFIQLLRDNENILEASALYGELFDRVSGGASTFNVEQNPRFSTLSDAGHMNGEFLFVPAG